MTLTKTLGLFFRPDDPIEIRFLGVERPGRIYAGWITLAEAGRVASQVAALERLASGVYFTPQILSPEIFSRGKRGQLGQVRRGADNLTTPKLTHDEDVIGRRYLLIDVDPTRAAGFEKCSASDLEKLAALEVFKSVVSALVGQGLGPPLVVDSGNGYHAYFRLPEPMPGGRLADTAGDGLSRLLRVLSSVHSTASAKVDTTVYNPARIMKLPGTWSKKGPNTKNRPHRQSGILEIPEGWHNV